MFTVAAVLAILKRTSWFCFATVLRDVRKKRAGPIRDSVGSDDMSAPLAPTSMWITVGTPARSSANARRLVRDRTHPLARPNQPNGYLSTLPSSGSAVPLVLIVLRCTFGVFAT